MVAAITPSQVISTYLDNDSIDRLMAILATIPSPETMIELAYLGGAAARFLRAILLLATAARPFVITLAGELGGCFCRSPPYLLGPRALPPTSAGDETGRLRKFHEWR